MKKTKWFRPEQKPELVGIYQTSEHLKFNDCFYNYWDGKSWHWGHANIELVGKNDPMPIVMVAKWRGLASNPSA